MMLYGINYLHDLSAMSITAPENMCLLHKSPLQTGLLELRERRLSLEYVGLNFTMGI